jgi:hypothetical protein
MRNNLLIIGLKAYIKPKKVWGIVPNDIFIFLKTYPSWDPPQIFD